MKKRILIIFIFLVCLIVPSVPINGDNSQEQKQVEKQKEALKEASNVLEGLEELQKEAEKYFKKLEPAQKRISFNKNVLSFETLDKIEKFEDLPKYGLVAPEQYNHNSGKNLILFALKATAWHKGNWVLAHGLLGVNMLDINVHDMTGYKSLFLSLTQRFKMYASYLNDDSSLLIGGLKPHGSLKSIIAKREALIYLISRELNGRYIYNDEGNFGRNYLPEKNRKSHKQLKQLLVDGLTVYDQLSQQGFDDKTLQDTLGMAYASLEYDGAYYSVTGILKLGNLQIYSDALTATLTRLKGKPNHSAEFLEELGWEMDIRGLSTTDEILTPSNDKNYQAILKIVEADLVSIRQPQTKLTDDISDTKETNHVFAAEEIVFTGIPQIKILIENGSQGTPEKLSQAKSIEYKCTITKMDDKYYWATRENTELIPIQSGMWTTFIAETGGGYVRLIDPEMKKILFKDGGQPYDYIEHLLLGLSTISYYGTSK